MVGRGSLADTRPVWAGVGAAALVVTIALAVPALTIVVALPLQGQDDSLLERAEQACYVAGFTTLAITGSVLLHRRPTHPMGWLLAAAGLAQLLTTLVMGYAALAVSSDRPLPDLLLWATNWLWVPAQSAVLLVLLRFPGGRLPSPRWRMVEGAVLLWGVLASAVTALLPGPVGASSLDHLDNPYGWSAMRDPLEAALGPLFLVLPALTVVSASALIWRWRGTPAEQRQQLRWVAAAAALTIVAAPLVLLGTNSSGAPLALALVLLPAAIAVAVLRSRLWELGVVARTVTAAVVTAALLLAAYVAMVRAYPASYVPALAGLGLAALGMPVHLLLRRGLDRFLLGTTGDPDAVARDLRSHLHTSPSDTLTEAATRLAETLRLPWVRFEGPDGAVLAASGPQGETDARARVHVPMLVAEERVGSLVTVERTAGEGLSPRDLRVLADVAQTCALLVRSVQVDSRLAESTHRLGTVRMEERARLQRDLHDGLGPVLGGISMHAEAARNLLGSGADVETVIAQLDSVDAGAAGAVGEVRRLVQELRPTGLGEMGLTEAVHQAIAEVAEHLHTVVDVDLPSDLDSRTEVAAYRIIVEAVRNAARHGEAQHVRIVASVQDGDLVLNVVDDGRGPTGAWPGVGMRTMRERAGELGGTLTITATGRGGCHVLARLPVVPEPVR